MALNNPGIDCQEAILDLYRDLRVVVARELTDDHVLILFVKGIAYRPSQILGQIRIPASRLAMAVSASVPVPGRAMATWRSRQVARVPVVPSEVPGPGRNATPGRDAPHGPPVLPGSSAPDRLRGQHARAAIGLDTEETTFRRLLHPSGPLLQLRRAFE